MPASDLSRSSNLTPRSTLRLEKRSGNFLLGTLDVRLRVPKWDGGGIPPG